MKPSKRTALGAAAIAVAGLAVPALASNNGTTKDSYGTQAKTCSGTGGDNVVALTGPEVLFPPNHKFVDESATATNANTALGNATLMLTPSTEDIAGGDGGPQHNPDYLPGDSGFSNTGNPAVVPFHLRAERSGKGDGRTYVINWYAQFNDGTTCGSMPMPLPGGAASLPPQQQMPPFTITVPHDQGVGAGNNG